MGEVEWRGVLFILVTGHTVFELREWFISAQANEITQKPLGNGKIDSSLYTQQKIVIL